jgi:hypothetical protein
MSNWKRLKLDTLTSKFISSGTFALAAALSGVLNINFFVALTTESWLFMMMMSLCLEGGKLVTLFNANTLSAINKKLRSAKIGLVVVSLFALYALFGVLAVVAATGFSQTAIEKASAVSTEQIANLEEDLQVLEEATLKVEEAKFELSLKKADRDKLQNEYESALQAAEIAYSAARTQATSYYSKRSVTEEGIVWEPGYSQAGYNEIWAARAEAEANVNSIKNGTAYTRAEEAIVDAENKLADTETSLVRLEEIYGNKDQVNANLRAARTAQREELGSAVMFTLIMEAVGHPEWAKSFRLFMLLFASLLLEVLIFVFSPINTVDRLALRPFRKWLPRGTDMEDLIKFFEEENSKFEYRETRKELNKEEKRWLEEKAVSLAQNKMDELKKQQEEELKKMRDEMDRVTQMRIDNEESYKRLLEDQKAEAETLRDQLKNASKENAATAILETMAAVSKPAALQAPVVTEIQYAEVDPEPVKPRRKRRSKEEIQAAKALEEKPRRRRRVIAETPIIVDSNESIEPEKILTVKMETAEDATVEAVIHESAEPAGTTDEQILKYRFGKCSHAVKEKFVKFVNALIEDRPIGSICKSLEIATKEAGLSEKQKNAFVGRLLEMTINGTPLVKRSGDNLMNDFTAAEIIEYTTKIVN